jgi:hypothetical protein
VTLDDLDSERADRWAPPPRPRPIRQFARTISLPDGPQQGDPWDPATEPAQDAWLAEWDSGRWSWFLMIASRQRGKTLLGILCALLWSIVELRRSVGVILPNLDKLAQNYESKYRPAFDNSGYKDIFPTKGPGSRGGRPAAITLRDPKRGGSVLGRVFFMALGKGASETSVSSVSPGTVLVDEADDAENAGQLANACGRIDGWGTEGRAVIVTTLNQRGDRIGHPSLAFYADGTRSRWGHTCPHCGECKPIEFVHVNLSDRRIACPSCHVLWTEEERRRAIAAGRYLHGTETPNRPRFLSVKLWELDFLRGSIDIIVDEYRAALKAKDEGDPSQWTVFQNKRLCLEDTQSDAEVPSTSDMEQAARATKSPHRRTEKPNGLACITVGADIGKRDGWHLTLGMKPDLSWYALDWGHRQACDPKVEPTPDDQRQMLSKLRERITRIGRADAMGVDVGYNTDLVQKWAKANGFACVRGDSRPTGKKDEERSRTLPSWADARRQDDCTVWLFIDGAAVKTEIAKSLARAPGSPGAGHLPQGQEAGDWLIRHLTAEVWDAKHGVWVKRAGRDNHLLDCLVYAWALAMLEILKPKTYYGTTQKDDRHDDFDSAVW